MLGGRKIEDTKVEAQRKKKVISVCAGLFLNNNEIRSVLGLRDILTSVMYHPSRLEWLDLSYNYLETIEPEILQFPCLKNLSLHGNYILQLDEVKKLADIPSLQNLTLYGNPLEQVKGYRLFVLGIMFSKWETLKRLDTVLITRMEFDGVLVWNERLWAGQTVRLKQLCNKI
jgi:hypothetical protein